MLRNITKGNDFIVFKFMKVSIFLQNGKNLVDSNWSVYAVAVCFKNIFFILAQLKNLVNIQP